MTATLLQDHDLHRVCDALPDQEKFWLRIAELYMLRSRVGYWWPDGHPTWGEYTPQIICPSWIVQSLVVRGLLHGIASYHLAYDERELHILRIKREAEAQSITLSCDPIDIDVVWPTPLGLQIVTAVDWSDVREAMAAECFTLYRPVG